MPPSEENRTLTESPPSASAPARRSHRSGLVVAVVLGFVIALVSSSMKNTISAFLVPMAHSFDVSRATFTIAPSAFMLVYALASPVMGYLADRWGARMTLVGGLVLGALLFTAGGLVHSFGWFSVSYGVGMAVAYAALSYVPLGVFVDELFPPHRRGITYAVLMNGTAAGFITLLPLWMAMGGGEVWRTVFRALGGTMLVLAVLALLLLPRDSAGASTAGASAPSTSQEGPADPPASSAERSRLSEVLHSKVFWTVSIAFIGCGVTMGFVDVDLVPYMTMTGMGGVTASTTVALLGVAEIAGGLVAGYFCDRGLALKVLIGCYLIRSVSLVVLILAPTAVNSWGFGLLFGISYLGTVLASSTFILNNLDPRTKGLALGLMWFLHQIGSFLASEGGGLSYDNLRSYDPVIIGSAAIAATSFLISSLALPRALHAPEPASA